MYDIIGLISTTILIAIFIVCIYLFDYLNEKCGNYDRYYNRKLRIKKQRRLDKQNRQADKRKLIKPL